MSPKSTVSEGAHGTPRAHKPSQNAKEERSGIQNGADNLKKDGSCEGLERHDDGGTLVSQAE